MQKYKCLIFLAHNTTKEFDKEDIILFACHIFLLITRLGEEIIYSINNVTQYEDSGFKPQQVK